MTKRQIANMARRAAVAARSFIEGQASVTRHIKLRRKLKRDMQKKGLTEAVRCNSCHGWTLDGFRRVWAEVLRERFHHGSRK